MRILLAVTFCLLFGTSVVASKQNMEWKWYFSSFGSPEQGSDVFVRSGTANIVFDEQTVEIKFNEKKLPEIKSTYIGSLKRNGEIDGRLVGFFFHGDEYWSGTYRQKNISGCIYEEFLLRLDAGAPDGSLMVITRSHGDCEVIEHK